MIDFVTHNMAPLMFMGLILFMLIGYPAAFSLGACGLFFGFIGIELGLIRPDYFGLAAFQLNATFTNQLLLSIPFFTLMGAILERCGLAEDLLDSIGQVFGPVRGGLSYAVIFVGAILGAITGTVAASVIAMAVIALPLMLRYGYSTRHATGVIAASGTITQLIPPSLVLVILAEQLGRSVGDMYKGALGPSLIQIALFCAWVAFLSYFYPKDVPALPPEARTLKGTPSRPKVIFLTVMAIVVSVATFMVFWEDEATPILIWLGIAFGGSIIMIPWLRQWPLMWKAARGIIPSMALILIVLGTIFAGVANATAAGALGVLGAFLLAWMNGRLTWALTYQSMSNTMRITAMVVFILIGARVFSLVFQGVGGKEWVEGMLTSLPGGQTGFLFFTMAFIFVIAFFLDFFEIAFIIVPLLAPAAEKLGIDLVWFGVLICANIQTSFMHPPFGFALFYLRGIAPKSVKTTDIYWGAVPWLFLQLALVIILIFWPTSVTYWLSKTTIDPSKVKIEIQLNDEPLGPPKF
ncbi:MAG: TRAP transporter large permease subunit [Xanthobacteraceae bacterium]|jgi:TRAP-type mannitol/chloroaromatic compound transport system permease large subunit|nr:TRAP transporter large permease subunit [Xanthobacteraceae bacterium]